MIYGFFTGALRSLTGSFAHQLLTSCEEMHVLYLLTDLGDTVSCQAQQISEHKMYSCTLCLVHGTVQQSDPFKEVVFLCEILKERRCVE